LLNLDVFNVIVIGVVRGRAMYVVLHSSLASLELRIVPGQWPHLDIITTIIVTNFTYRSQTAQNDGTFKYLDDVVCVVVEAAVA